MMRARQALLAGAVILLGACGDDSGMAPDANVDASVDASVDAAPAALPDLRFKFVGAFDAYSGSGLLSGVPYQATSTTVVVSPQAFEGSTRTNIRQSTYSFAPAGPLDSFTSIAAIALAANPPLGPDGIQTKHVLYSLAFAPPYVAYTGIAPPGDLVASYRIETSQPTSAQDLAVRATAAASQGDVITAVGFDGTAIQTVAYGIAQDPHTYTATVMTGAPATLAAAAPGLVSGGAFITAFGPIDATNYAIVATTVSGSSTPRSIIVAGDDGIPSARSLLGDGYAIVGGYVDASHQSQFLLEK